MLEEDGSGGLTVQPGAATSSGPPFWPHFWLSLIAENGDQKGVFKEAAAPRNRRGDGHHLSLLCTPHMTHVEPGASYPPLPLGGTLLLYVETQHSHGNVPVSFAHATGNIIRAGLALHFRRGMKRVQN